MNAISISITKPDGTREPFDANRINASIERACTGLSNVAQRVAQIGSETQLTLYDGMTEKEIDEATISAALQNVKEDVEFDAIATRILLKTVYKSVLGDFSYRDMKKDVQDKHVEMFPRHIRRFVEEGIFDTRMESLFDLGKLARALDTSRDELFIYSGLSTLLHRYALKENNGEDSAESPQFTFMRVAMGLSYNEANPTESAIHFYDLMSQHRYLPGGSTFLGAGTMRPALSNCFLIEMQDDMDHIAKTVSDVLKISKSTGGIGISMTQLRATGSQLKSSNTQSSGFVPFAKIIDVAIRAVIRGGKKMGAAAIYMEPWHYDFPDFLELRHNAGDDHVRLRTANTSAFLNDEFMKRVRQGEDWYLFDPNETRDLIELYGSAFSKRYAEYIEQARKGKIKMWKKMKATEIWRRLLVALQTTSHPWPTFKGTINLRALNNNTGTIHMSNLCTEICLPQDRDNIAVCNLASLNLSRHIDMESKQVEWQKLERTVRMAVRHLDNLIDINQLPVAEAIKSDKENRAVGLGVMGLADVFEKLRIPYDSEEAYQFTDQVFEFVSYMAIDESADLARERGLYENFKGSGWSKGMVPIDTLKLAEKDRGIAMEIPVESFHKGLDWDNLRKKVKEGMRNATLLAVAPNANIGLVAGTTPGLDVRFSQMFARKKFSGRYMDLNHNLARDLVELGIWEQVRQKIVEHQGDISDIAEIPEHIKATYKTSFSTSPYGVIDVTARAQKWIDQAISRNMYLETRNVDEMMRIYMYGWLRGVKTFYYLHMKPRHTAEQSTVKVNKATALGKRGFGAVSEPASLIAKISDNHVVSQVQETEERVSVRRTVHMPEDPADEHLCDSCQ